MSFVFVSRVRDMKVFVFADKFAGRGLKIFVGRVTMDRTIFNIGDSNF